MERKIESVVSASRKLLYGRIEQLRLEGLSREEAIKRTEIELAFGESSKWPGSKVLESLIVAAHSGIRPDIDKSGGRKYSRKIDL